MKCEHCNEHEATGKWLGEGSILDYAHGRYQEWCECCMVKAQLDHARKLAARIPELEAACAEMKQVLSDLFHFNRVTDDAKGLGGRVQHALSSEAGRGLLEELKALRATAHDLSLPESCSGV